MDDLKDRGRPPLAFLVLAAVLAPSAAGIAFRRYIGGHPGQSIALVIAYEAAIAFAGFAGRVWKLLMIRWTERFALWFEALLQAAFSRYFRQYRQHILNQHWDFDDKVSVKAKRSTLELKRVFVDLRIVLQTPDSSISDPLQTSAIRPRSEPHPIEWYLSSRTGLEQHLVIKGPPGSGKSTLLRHLALMLADRRSTRPKHLNFRMPVLLALHQHAGKITESSVKKLNYTLANAFEDYLKQTQLPSPLGWADRQLRKGHCLIMLDGLDEVANPKTRSTIAQWVELQMRTYSRNRFVITSRPFGYDSNPISGVTVLDVQAFTSDQIKKFLDNWYLANEIVSANGRTDSRVRSKAEAGSRALWSRLHDMPAILELAVNPLLLTMIASVHLYNDELPGSRVDLYRSGCSVLLGDRHVARGIKPRLAPKKRQTVIQPLAYEMMRRQIKEVGVSDALAIIREPLASVAPNLSGNDFLEDVQNNGGLLLERETGVFGFVHHTFQEYLAAVHVRQEGLDRDLVRHVGESWWYETLRFYSALGDATAIVEACLDATVISVPLLTLAIECAEEAHRIKPAVRKRLDFLLDKAVEDSDSQLARVAAEAILTIRLRRMAPISDNVYSDTTLITWAEYQLFLDDMRARGAYHQPDHWNALRFHPGDARIPALGIRSSNARAFCEWLTERDAVSGWRYRLPAGNELGMSVSGIPLRFSGSGYWTMAPPNDDRCVGEVFDGNSYLEAFNAFASELLLRDRARARLLILNRANTRVLDLDHALDIAIDRDHTLVQSHSRVRELGLLSNIGLCHKRVHDQALELDRVRIGDLTVARDLALVRDLVLKLAQARPRDLARARARVLAQDLAVAVDRLEGVEDLMIDARGDIRASALVAAGVSLLIGNVLSRESIAQRGLLSSRHKSVAGNYALIVGVVQACFDLYAAYATIEARANGVIRPHEGVLVVRERRENAGYPTFPSAV